MTLLEATWCNSHMAQSKVQRPSWPSLQWCQHISNLLRALSLAPGISWRPQIEFQLLTCQIPRSTMSGILKVAGTASTLLDTWKLRTRGAGLWAGHFPHTPLPPMMLEVSISPFQEGDSGGLFQIPMGFLLRI